MRIAVVRNRERSGIINRFGQVSPEKYGNRTVQMVAEALADSGNEVAVLEGDKTLLAQLEQFMPPDPDGQPTGIVFNMAYGIQGECRYTHVPAMLEMAGVPYTGSSPFGHALALDKVVTKILLENAGVPTPRYRVLANPDQPLEGIRFPVVVKPRHESTSYGLGFAKNSREAAESVGSVVEQYQQEALVEEYIDGREFCVGLVGNQEMEFLPIVESDFGERDLRLVTRDDKFMRSACEPRKICPATIDDDLASSLRELSMRTFRSCHCKDFARVDIRVDADGNPYVLEINSMASLGRTGSFVQAAQTAGYDFPALIRRILDETYRRYFAIRAESSLKARAVGLG